MKVKYPKIPEYFDVIDVSKNKMLLKDPKRYVLLEGKSVDLVRKIFNFLDGKTSIEKIHKKSGLSRKEIEEIVALLHENRILYDENQTKAISRSEEIKWLEQHIGFFSRRMDYTERFKPINELMESSLTLIGVGAIGSHVLSTLIKSSIGKIRVIDHETVKNRDIELGLYSKVDVGKNRCMALKDIYTEANENKINFEWHPLEIYSMKKDTIFGDSDLIILCSDTISPSIHDYLNEICFEHKKNWLSVRYSEDHGEVGPLVIPHQSSCYKCYNIRLKSNVDNIEEHLAFEKHLKHFKENYGSLGMFMRVIAGYASLEIIKMLTKYCKPTTLGGVLSIDFGNYTNTFHNVLKIPNCPACGALSDSI